MFRRPIVVLGVVLVAAIFAAPALALEVHVRVEGLNSTIYGAREPLLTPVSRPFAPPDGPFVYVNKPTPIGALERASRRGEFYYRVKAFSFGPYVDRIGRYPAADSSGWVYKVNHASPPVGASAYTLKDGDHVLWYFAHFGAEGGPKTLDLARRPEGCFWALLADDNGVKTRARDVVFVLDGRSILSARGAICPRGHWHGLRAKKRGAIRSEVLGPARS